MTGRWRQENLEQERTEGAEKGIFSKFGLCFLSDLLFEIRVIREICG